MEKLQWDNSLSVGIELIDGQHQMLIQRLDEFAAAVQANLGVTQIVKTLTFLIEYTEFHFDAEEKHMADSGYPGLESHHQMHEDLKTTLAGLEQDFREDGATEVLAESIHTLMVNWLVKHIREVDTQFSAYLKDKGITIS
ncbi:MAG TPA: bacteriohemerythrin [Thermoguttaceae bacterium]|nr:bacteriohemerythrin [Thermoguttaceae bacterium]